METRDIFWMIVIVILGVGSLFLFEKLESDRENAKQKVISYMEQAGIGVVLGKALVGNNNDTEVAIQFKQFKDTILYSKDKEWYYLLKEGDRVKIKDKKIYKIN